MTKVIAAVKKAVTKKAVKKEVEVTEPVTCSHCDGRGLETTSTLCPVCHGNGTI